VAQDSAQHVRRQTRVPRADSLSGIIQNAHKAEGHVAQIMRGGKAVGTRRHTCRRHLNVREVRLFAGTGGRLRNVERERRAVAATRVVHNNTL
jgi:hypothetical protein